MKLYEIGEKYLALQRMLEDGEYDEDAINNTLEAIETAAEDKIDNIACLIKSMESEANAIQAEIKKLEARAKAKSNSAERLKNYAKGQMALLGLEKVETARNVVRLGAARDRVAIDDLDALINYAESSGENDLITYSAPEPSKKLIAKKLKNGETIPGAKLEKGEPTLTIR